MNVPSLSPETSPTAPPWLDKSDQASWKALNATLVKVDQALKDASVPATVSELSNIRISQINGCIYCLNVHMNRARKFGISQQKLDLLTAWRDSEIYTPAERQALELGETVTRLGDHQTIRTVRLAAIEVLGEPAVTAIEWGAILMNSYNRISILSGHPVAARED